MLAFEHLDRRAFLKKTGLVGGVFILGFGEATFTGASPGLKSGESGQLGVFVSIDSQGQVTIASHRAEMGQGIMTSTPQIIADEMEADWQRVEVVLAPGHPRYGNQSTGGSASIRRYFTYIRQMGAVARQMLEQAAANHWKIKLEDVQAVKHAIKNKKTGAMLGFGELASAAATLEVPTVENLRLKTEDEYSLIGKDVKLMWQEQIVRGETVYAQDINVPGMLIACIARPPVVGGRVKSFDASEAKKIKGVVDVLRMKDRPLPADVNPVSGVAVLANTSWAALQGKKKLKIEWELGENARHNSESYKQELIDKVNAPGIVARQEGDVHSHSFDPENTVEATYTLPYQHHMPMETPAATAYFEGDKCIVWTGTQTPQWGQRKVCQELGLDEKKDLDKVEFNQVLMGGAFGRKGKNDYTLEAVELAKATGKPVKVIWSREDDVQHGFYHSIAANYFKAELNKDNNSDFWLQRVVHPPIGWTFDTSKDRPSRGNLSQGFADIPFDIENLSCETQTLTTHVRIGWFRAVQNVHNAYALGCFVDELAVKAGIPTREMWLNLLGSDRHIDLTKEGFEGWRNYGQEDPRHALDTARMKHVINSVVEKSGAEDKVDKNEGWGIAFATSFNSYVAAATKVRVSDNLVKVLEIHTAIDCGLVITPDRVKAQMEGAMIMGLGLASSEITIADGAIEQSNFHDYPVLRYQHCPELFVNILPSDKPPGGVGEPGMPPVLPSVVNAIYHASGVRLRHMPVTKTHTFI